MNDKLQMMIPQLEKAIGRLGEALNQPKNDFIRDSAIQRFEFTFELVWKTVKTYCKDQSLEVYSPKESIKTAFQIGLIDENPMWLEMLKLRNLTAHTYNEAVAEEIYQALPEILKLYKTLLEKLRKSEV